MFIAPEGAMQFELQRSYKGDPASSWLWVRPVERPYFFLVSCKCKDHTNFLEVVGIGDIPANHRAIIDAHTAKNPGQKFHVCPCVGHLIE